LDVYLKENKSNLEKKFFLKYKKYPKAAWFLGVFAISFGYYLFHVLLLNRHLLID
jgi:hypothetical protein